MKEKIKKFYVYIDRLERGKNAGEIIYVGKGDDGRIKAFDRNVKYNRKYSKYGIKREIALETFDEKFAYDEEICLIAEYHSYYKDPLATKNACNFTKGGNSPRSCFSHSPEETRRLMSLARKGKKRTYKQKQTLEHIENRCRKIRGQKRTPEQKKKISQETKHAMNKSNVKLRQKAGFKTSKKFLKFKPQISGILKEVWKNRTKEQKNKIVNQVVKSRQLTYEKRRIDHRDIARTCETFNEYEQKTLHIFIPSKQRLQIWNSRHHVGL